MSNQISMQGTWVALLLALFFAWATPAQAACPVFASGTYIEAENNNAQGDFKLKNDSNASGGDYLRTKGSKPASFVVDFPETGAWYLWVLGKAKNKNGSWRDTIKYGLNGTQVGVVKITNHSGYNWDNKGNSGPDPARLNITSTGALTINFWNNEKEFKFDGFFLTKSASMTPSGQSPAGGVDIDPSAGNCGGNVPVDADNDGFFNTTDCNDNNAAINPGVAEVCGNGVDDNCDGNIDENCAVDVDGDGYDATVDCNDNDPAINPGAMEICGDLVDNNCDNQVDEGCDPDFDGDGYPQSTDCDDSRSDIHPNATEICDGLDNDCDGLIDPNCDMDGDGVTNATDCNDSDPLVYPGAIENCSDALDNNCDGQINEGCSGGGGGSGSNSISQIPLFLSQGAPPLNLLVLGRDHKLFYEAYNDASDLNADGSLDIRFEPGLVYFGYFDADKCYTYNSSTSTFEPSAVVADANLKTCSGASEWSGNWLNYVTTSRMDALRKVLYGGYRSTDGPNDTVIERSNVPQDAHSWGKEYTGVWSDGYDIRDYTPLNLPASGTRHLFANTSLGDDVTGTTPNPPLLRVLDNSTYRIWEWVSIERPVAGAKCLHGKNGPACAHAGGAQWEIVPSDAFVNLQMTTFDASSQGSHPNNAAEFGTFVTNVLANTSGPFGSGLVTKIDGTGNPWGANDHYLTVFKGQIKVDVEDDYTLGVDGDDAVQVSIDGNVVAGWYGGHGSDPSQLSTHSGTIHLTAGLHSITFLHEEMTGGDNYYLYYSRVVPASAMTDYEVRVQVCVPGLLEENCKQYPSGVYKPTGLLQQYGEDDSMRFGLLTGSYHKNTSGGVLRKKVGSFADEINTTTGQFNSTVGIAKTIDRLRTVGFDGASASYNQNCGWITNGPISEGKCRMWGNPIGEMMYEGLRYFAGFASPLPAYDIPATGTDDYGLNLPLATWDDPYASGNNEVCARPFELVISDINPSYDTDQLPGVYSDFGSMAASSINGQSLNVETIADSIWNHEFGSGTSKNVFIGQSGTTSDFSPKPKSVSSFGDIRGLSPEEPTKLGGYYSASIANFGQTHDISSASDVQNMSVFSVALASPLPRIDIPVGGSVLTLVPFAKSVAGSSISATQGNFQPTNQIVDFYVDTLTPTYGKFRINYEDVEQGADHDMDAIVEYIYHVNADNTVTVTLNSVYAAGGIDQHMGYVMSGSTADGIYLEVRDCDTANPNQDPPCTSKGNNPATDPDYFLDTPPGQEPSGVWADSLPLPLTNSRTFTPAAGVGVVTADFLKNPLWYAAKYGNFEDLNGNDMPDSGEWDTDPDIGGDGVPDNYFKVTNALNLGPQLSKAFEQILGTSSSASAIATNSTRLDTDTLVYQARFNSDDWSGDLKAYPVLNDGSVGSEQWDASSLILAANSATRKVFTYRPDTQSGVPFLAANLSATQLGYLNKQPNGTVDNLAAERVSYIRGSQANEAQNGGSFRDRTVLLGDIVNSDPWFVGSQDYGYSSISGTEGSTYVSFRNALLTSGRTPTLYVGSNDGMLHAFNADTAANGGGSELFAYLPGFLIPSLNELTHPSYTHKYFVDGSPRATDAYIDLNNDSVPEWHTILVGMAGAGAKGVFALDVTDPTAFGGSKVLWEITDQTTGFGNLGYGINQQPFIVRLRTGQWVAVFGNGYESTSGKAVMYVVDLKTGAKLFEFDSQVGDTINPNGMSGVTPVDYDADRSIDALYAGDLQGHLWKVDLTNSNTAQWKFAFKNGANPAPLFTAHGPSGNIQSITTRPEVGKGPSGNATEVMVYFGTGSYFKTGDNSVSPSPPVETMYGILDKRTNNSQITVTDRSVLRQQEILAETSSFGFSLRVLSKNSVNWSVQRGWYLDLVSPGPVAKGERVIDTPILIGTSLVFTTLVPSGSDCDFGGSGWLMEIDPLSGSRIGHTVFDLNNDSSFTTGDDVTVKINNVDITVPVSGKKSNDGIITIPGIISAGDKEFKLSSTSSGTIETTVEKSSSPNKGRGSWRQLR